ncbi:hypothetical protein [uncultured Prochlorococcus sp.]|uniref:hypothetical protein n=1 Tax=uncultured Prochlorococcus sp. TaxID=159733 RepID=UPI00258A81FA|nr:hypothetical protein [uncultured Prochlorococcus sp.]
MKLPYYINNEEIVFEAPEDTHFFYGEKVCLSQKFNDICKDCDWYDEGYTILDFTKYIDINLIKKLLRNIIIKIISEVSPKIDLSNFELNKYHKYIKNHSQHLEISKRAKRLYFTKDEFPDQKIIKFIENAIQKKLSFSPNNSDFVHWVIVRINPPYSKGFNPAHKDIYEEFDMNGFAPQMVNSWIPICGVNKKTGLPIAPKTHLLNEDLILRTRCGSTLEGQNYSVNCIKSWNGDSSMKLIYPKEGEMLLFSSHLIHGLGVNNNDDETRISLEFRLHENNNID